MVADFIPFVINSFYKRNIIFRINTHQEKRSRHIFLSKNIKYLWRIFWIGAIVKSQYYLFAFWLTIFSYYVRRRQAIIIFFTDKHFGGIYLGCNASGFWQAHDVQYFSVANIIRFTDGIYLGKFIQIKMLKGIPGHVFIIKMPEPAVFCAQS